MRTDVRPGSEHPRSAAAASRATRAAAQGAAKHIIEPLECRTLLAATLDAGFAESTYVTGFDTPTAEAFAPDGRLFVLEKAGRVRIVNTSGQLLSTPLVTLSNVDTTQDRGLVGLAFDPNFAQDNFLYLWYTRTDGSGTRNRLSRFTLSGNTADPSTERVIIESPMTTNIHTGGAMAFGTDGYLYLGIGEGGVSSAAQDLTDLRGKILRIDPSVDGFPADPLRNYTIPLNNPFYGSSSARGEIYAYGFRNPFTGQMRPGTSQFYIGDVGDEAFEEINVVQAGGNYGWPGAEGASAATNDVDPIYQYSHTGYSSAALTGIAFNTGNQFPLAYANNVFFGDYLNGFMRRLDPSTNGVAGFGTNIAGAVDLDFGPDGSLYYLSVSGNGFQGTNRPIYKISYVGSANRAPSAVSVAANATNGLAPLTVNFSGQGSSDPDNDTLTYSWTFGDGQTGTGLNVSHTYAANGTFNAILTVSDGKGGTSSAQPITVTVGNRAPTGTITSPAIGTTYKAGDTITFSGTASDPEDGTLPASSMTWTVKLLHNTHSHDTVAPITGSGGSFTIPATGHVEANQGYRVFLTVTDSQGLTYTTSRDIAPKSANLTIASNPTGAPLTLDGQSLATVLTQSLVGATRTLSAPLKTTINGVLWTFVSWSDGGAATHDISVPSVDTTYTATYQADPSAQTPYAGGAPAPVPGTIEAENFDEGGANIAYFDNSAGNLGGSAYRTGDVDVEIADDVNGGYDVGYLQAGEWMEYTVDVASSGVYTIDTRVASGGAGGTFHIEFDGANKTGPISLNNTGGWSNWQTITTAGVSLTAGRHIMRVAVDTSTGDIGRLNWIKFTQTGSQVAQAPFGGTPIAIPGPVEVENFDIGGQGVAYNDLSGANEGNSAYRNEAVDLEVSGDTGGGVNLGYAQPGEWLEYAVNVATAGTYTLGARVASLGAGGTFHVEIDGANASGSIAVPDTGGWQTYQAITKTGLAFPAGQHVLRLAFDSAGATGFVGNLNFLQFTAVTTPTNQPPVVNAGADQVITFPATANLSGTASDDGLPTGSTLSTGWGKVSGPGTVTFGNAAARSTTVSFSAAGTYVLRLTASDGSLSSSDDVTIVVNAAAVTPVAYNPTADTYAQDGSTAGTNYGSAKTLIVKRSNSAGSSREAYFKFDLTAFAGSAANVKLRLYGFLQDTREQNVLTDVYSTGTTWTETALNWNNRPASATKLGTLTVKNTTGQYYDLDVTPFVQQELAAGQKVVAFLLRNPNTSMPYSAFNSRESGSNKPQLVVTPSGTATNQEPAVNAGPDLTVTLPSSVSLDGTVTDDGLPAGSTLVTTWTKVSGPGTVTFANAAATDTTATFSAAGTYVLRLGASDGTLSATDDVAVVVNAAQSGGPTPFSGTPIALPGRIEAENFDNGGAGVAYADADAGNKGGAYRTGVDVDLETADDTGGGYNIGWIRAGEWLKYTVNVASSGTYNFDMRVASGNPGGTFHVEVDGVNVTGTMNLFSTGGWSSWQTISKSGIALTAGTHVVKLSFDSTFAGDIGRVNWLQFGTTAAAPAAGEVWVQQSVLAEDSDGSGSTPPFVGPTNPWFLPDGGGPSPADTLPTVTSLSVIDADTDQPIAGLTNLISGQTIDLAKTPSKRINIRANTSGTAVGSVRFGFDGNADYVVENGAPFAIASDSNGDYNAWTPPIGLHALSATAYTDAGAAGTAGPKSSILFNVIDSGVFPWPATDRWTQAADSPIDRFEAAGHALNGQLYTFGGYADADYHVTKRLDTFNPATNTWTRKADLPADLAETHIGIADDGRYIYLAGGFAGDLVATNTPSQTASDTVYRYDPQADTYQQLPSLPAPRGAGGLAIVGRQMYYIAGNLPDRVTNTGDCWALNLDGGTAWTEIASHPNPKDHFSTVVLNGKIYTAGGEHGHDQLNEQQSDLHVYDPATNVWSRLADMPLAKSHNESATFVLDGRIVFAGGQINHFEATDNVVSYNPVTDSWSTLASLPEIRQGATINRVGGKLVITQGAIVTDGPMATTWMY